MELSMEESFSLLSSWRKEVHNRLECYLLRQGIPPKLILKLLNSINTITHNVVNGMELKKAIDESIEFIHSRAPSLNKEDIYRLFIVGDARFSGSFSTFRTKKKKYKPKNIRLYPLCDIEITRSKYNWFLNFEKKDVIKLIARYDFIPPSSSFFWSIHPDIYRHLQKYNPIEGFASPFNFNSKIWCSRFEEDKKFGSSGNFFHVIASWKEEKTLWVINPPYTFYLFERVLECIISRQVLFPKDEFIFLLPYWDYTDLYKYVKENGRLTSLENGKFKIYDHYSEKDVSPPVEMTLGYIGKDIYIQELVDLITIK